MRRYQSTLLLILAALASVLAWQGLQPFVPPAIAGLRGLAAQASVLHPCVAWTAAGLAFPLVGSLFLSRGRCGRRGRPSTYVS